MPFSTFYSTFAYWGSIHFVQKLLHLLKPNQINLISDREEYILYPATAATATIEMIPINFIFHFSLFFINYFISNFPSIRKSFPQFIFMKLRSKIMYINPTRFNKSLACPFLFLTINNLLSNHHFLISNLKISLPPSSDIFNAIYVFICRIN